MRPAAVAGSFYPAEKTRLRKQVENSLGQIKKIKSPGNLRILIVPHAGYSFSGSTAAWGYKQIQGSNVSKVILLGCSHRTPFSGAAVYNQGSWQTPLGKVKIDEQLASALIKQSKLTEANLEVHEQEHSLEVQLPFLQSILSDFKIVPVLLGQTNNQDLKNLAQTITKNFDESSLLVVSSDLSHYPAYEVANKVDKQTIKAILSGKVEGFEKVISQNIKYPGVDTLACGAEAIKTGMMTAEILNLKPAKLLHYSNSGDSGGTKSRVVGYTSIGFYGKVK